MVGLREALTGSPAVLLEIRTGKSPAPNCEKGLFTQSSSLPPNMKNRSHIDQFELLVIQAPLADAILEHLFSAQALR